MAATALASFFSPERVDVTLVESPEQPTVGVGESTIPAIRTFNSLIGLDDATLIREAGATFKLGIEFDGWQKAGTRYIHPFGEHGIALDSLAFYHYWHRLQAAGKGGPLVDYSICAISALANKFSFPVDDQRSPLSGLSHAFHLDAHRYVALLRKLAMQRGVTHVVGHVVETNIDNNGNLSSILLADRRRVSGDFFIDCTGFKSLLIEDVLKTEFEDWSQWLPCNRAVVQASDPLSPLPSYTKATARSAGWQWRIPLQHRCGNGYVYSDRYISDEDALNEFEQNLPSTPTGSPRVISFKTGFRRQSWKNNCLALGLSAGFIEPLESTSIHMIQRAILLFLDLFPADVCDCSPEARQLNEQMYTLALSVRDFIMLHYVVNEKRGLPFWDDFRKLKLPTPLQHKIQLYQHGGRIYQRPGDLFSEHAWLAVLSGQGLQPQHVHPLTLERPLDVIEQQLRHVKGAVHAAVERMPDHDAFISRIKAR